MHFFMLVAHKFQTVRGVNEDVVEYVLTLMLQNGWVLPCNIDEALTLFGDLLIGQEQIDAL